MSHRTLRTWAFLVATLIVWVGVPAGLAQIAAIKDANFQAGNGNSLFGRAIAAMGTGHVIIGAPNKDLGATAAGEACLYDTNGTLVTTFTNPMPATWGGFGAGVAGVGVDRILVVGILTPAYLFDQSGRLLTTFTNTSNTLSGVGAALGTDRVVIGASAVPLNSSDARSSPGRRSSSGAPGTCTSSTSCDARSSTPWRGGGAR